MRQIVREHRTKNTFKIYWLSDNKSQLKESIIELDFNPLINHVLNSTFKANYFCLVHWQARPKGLRQWGVFDSTTSNYYASRELSFKTAVEPKTIQLDELKIKTLPTAVVFFPYCKVVNYLELETASNSDKLTPVIIGK